jgi:four helix bundle protein
MGDVLGKQLLKSGTSLGANYREALRGSSRRHFITLLEIAQREADETLYWLEIIRDAGVIDPPRLTEIITECRELLAIFTSTIVTTKRRT